MSSPVEITSPTSAQYFAVSVAVFWDVIFLYLVTRGCMYLCTVRRIINTATAYTLRAPSFRRLQVTVVVKKHVTGFATHKFSERVTITNRVLLPDQMRRGRGANLPL